MTNLVLYTYNTTGADTNSGSSEGSAKANGTAATRAAAVYTLDGSPDLSGVVDNQDTIHIVGETSGRLRRGRRGASTHNGPMGVGRAESQV